MITEGWINKLKDNDDYQKIIAKYQKKPPKNPRKKALDILNKLTLK